MGFHARRDRPQRPSPHLHPPTPSGSCQRPTLEHSCRHLCLVARLWEPRSRKACPGLASTTPSRHSFWGSPASLWWPSSMAGGRRPAGQVSWASQLANLKRSVGQGGASHPSAPPQDTQPLTEERCQQYSPPGLHVKTRDERLPSVLASEGCTWGIPGPPRSPGSLPPHSSQGCQRVIRNRAAEGTESRVRRSSQQPQKRGRTTRPASEWGGGSPSKQPTAEKFHDTPRLRFRNTSPTAPQLHVWGWVSVLPHPRRLRAGSSLHPAMENKRRQQSPGTCWREEAPWEAREALGSQAASQGHNQAGELCRASMGLAQSSGTVGQKRGIPTAPLCPVERWASSGLAPGSVLYNTDEAVELDLQIKSGSRPQLDSHCPKGPAQGQRCNTEGCHT